MSENLSVAIYTDSYRPAMDGVVVYIDNIAREMSRRGISVLIVTTGNKTGIEKSEYGFEILRTRGITFPTYPQYRIGISPFRANREAIRRKVDVVHTQTPFSMGFAGRLAARRLNSVFISTFHSMVFDETVISSYSRSGAAVTRRIAAIMRRYLKWHYAKYNTVISPSDDIAGKIRGIGISNVTVLNNGIDLNKFHTDLSKEEARKTLGLDTQDKIILYLGRIGKEKDLDILINAHEHLAEYGINVIIAGSGPHLKYYKEYAREKNAGNVRFYGFVSEEDKILLYRSADIFCNPSGYEVQSTVDIEAMSLGTPILVPDRSSQIELARSGISGEIFIHGNSQSLSENAEKMFNSIDRYSPETVAKEFSIERHVDLLVEQYRKFM